MLSLFKTTDTFMPYGFPAPSVPIFVDERSMGIVAIPSLWMVYLATVPGSTRSPKTWMAYGVGLLDWLRTCEAAGWDWRTAHEEHIAQYRNNLLNGKSAFTKRRYARSTANAYVRSICVFYEWAFERSLIAHCPVRSVKRPIPSADATGVLAHLGPTASHLQKRVLAVKQPLERLPRFFTVEETSPFYAVP